MFRSSHILSRLWHWLQRFPHRRGYGVHSPYAFQFITGVVYCSDAYYAYDNLRHPLQASISRLDEYDPESGIIAKDLRLLFRLANFAEARNIVLCGASQAVESYIHAACPSATITLPPIAADSSTPHDNSQPTTPFDLAYCDTPDALSSIPRSRMTICRGIHTNPLAQKQWQAFAAQPHVTLTFDLWRFGIALFHPKLTPQHYIVCYL